MEGSGGAAAAMDRDRLSDLPDSLLQCILSRLGSRQVVQTCMLSRRWIDLWRAAWSIDLDDREFLSNAVPHHGGDAAALKHREKAYDRFEDFADNLLLRRAASSSASPPLDTFRMCVVGKDIRNRNPTRWVRRGLRFSPAALDLGCRNGSFRIDLAAGYPGLTRLRLENVVELGTFMYRLDALFPVLEELDLKGCSFSVLEIASATIKHLAMDSCREGLEFLLVVPIVAPRLASLRLAISLYRKANSHAHRGPSFTSYSLPGGAPPSLERASILVVDTDRYLDAFPPSRIVRKMMFLDSLRELLGSLSGVSFLELSGLPSVVVKQKGYVGGLAEGDVSVPLLQVILDDDPVFTNMKTLVLRDCDLGDDLQTLRRFLQKTPLLETLRLQHCKLPNGLQRKRERPRVAQLRAPSVTEVELFRDVELVGRTILLRFGSKPGMLIPGCSRGTKCGLKLVEIQYKDDEDLTEMTSEEQEEHAHKLLYEVLQDISQDLQTTAHATKVE